MEINQLIGTSFTFIAATLAALFGLIYLTRPKFMNYHRMAVQKEWTDLSNEMQTLITALMRALSAGFLAVAFILVALQIEFNRHHDHLVALFILITGGVLFLGSMYAMILVRTRTKGRPPVILVSVIFALLIAAYFFNIYS